MCLRMNQTLEIDSAGENFEAVEFEKPVRLDQKQLRSPFVIIGERAAEILKAKHKLLASNTNGKTYASSATTEQTCEINQ